jgi:hypothetical protein
MIMPPPAIGATPPALKGPDDPPPPSSHAIDITAAAAATTHHCPTPIRFRQLIALALYLAAASTPAARAHFCSARLARSLR